MALRIVATKPNPALVTLPWHLSLDEWGDDVVVPLPRGISRHIVRIVRLGQDVYAVKQTREQMANREYRLLRDLRRLGLPAVEPVGVVSGREAADGEEIEPALVTRHLQYSLPYRSLFSHGLPHGSLPKILDALVVLLVRLHLSGLLLGRRVAVQRAVPAQRRRVRGVPRRRRDRGAARHPQRRPARARPRGGADQHLRRAARPAGRRAAQRVRSRPTTSWSGSRSRYDGLWRELTGTEEYTTDEIWRIEQRMERLNELGFDVDELDIVTDWDGATVRVQPKVVEANHHARELQRLTGLDVEDNQARRLLNDLAAFTAHHDLGGESRSIVAHRWLTTVYEPITAMVPPPTARPARAGRGVPRDPRAPVVPVRAARPPGAHRRRRPRPTSTTCSPPAPRRSSPANPTPTELQAALEDT